MALTGALLVALLGAAVARESPKACGLLAPPDAKPIIEVAAKRARAPLAVYPLGFSRKGRLAWLESRLGFDSDQYNWLLYVVDLSTDRQLVEREFLMKSASVQALCARHEATIARVLDKMEIERGPALPLEQPDAARDPSAVDLVAGRRDREAHKTPYRVMLRGKDGVKQLGVLWKVDVDSGEPPVGPPKLAGILRSPFEARVAVVVTQQMVATEGAEISLVKVLGGRLDRGWRHTGQDDP